VLPHPLLPLLVTDGVDNGVKTASSSDDGVELCNFARHRSMIAGIQPLILALIGSITSASSRVSSSSRASYRARSSCGLMPCCSSIIVRDTKLEIQSYSALIDHTYTGME
jgi:hypothetical protein